MTSRKVIPDEVHKEILKGGLVFPVVNEDAGKNADTILTLPEGATLTVSAGQAGNGPSPDPEPEGEIGSEPEEEPDEEENPFE
ncbi:MAG: hypothetical protein ABSG80_17145 [Verrucomicrobiota bacterium]|jgi:hypothetical protein|nr:hypothetical protein [Deltaproteobacteria bacterium]